MGSRLLFSAIVSLAAFAMPVIARADGLPAEHHARHHGSHYHHHRLHGGYFGYIGGHKYGYTVPMPPFNDSENYPGWYNNQTFWERVQTQRNYPVQY
jgi:hypothetical protein